jgi:hypothetical protein
VPLARARLLCCAAALACGLTGCGNSEQPDPPPGDAECSGDFDQFEVGMSKRASPEPLRIELVSAEPSPPAVRTDNAWRLRVADADGAMVTGAELVVSPYMPAHQHGSAEVIVTELGEGQYELSPIELIMPGVWEIPVAVSTLEGTSSEATFRFCIAEG